MPDYLAMLGVNLSNLVSSNEISKAGYRLGDQFYVYALWRTDGDVPVPFYIGKGRCRRAAMHGYTWLGGSNAHKHRIIERLRSLGLEPLYSIIWSGPSEDDAFAKETDFIAMVGRRDLKDGPLANMTNGGDGMSGHLAPKGISHHRARKVVAEGMEFLTMNQACDTLGVSRAAIHHRIRNGWPGYQWPDQKPEQCRKGRRTGSDHHKTRPVSVNGVQYNSVSHACEKTGLPMTTLYKRIQNGWDGHFFVDKGQQPRTRPARKPRR